MTDLITHVHGLAVPPVLDVRGEWIHLRNARVATTSMDEGPLRGRCIMKRRDGDYWEAVWNHIIVPNWPNVKLFTFVRNPWGRICSAFYQCRDRARTAENKISKQWEFNEWVTEVLARLGPGVNMHFAEQYPTAYFEGEQFSEVGRYENMATDWGRISQLIGMHEGLPHLNAAINDEYAKHYNDESRRIVGELYQRDIAAFGYEFGK